MEKLEELEQNISYMESVQFLTQKDWENIKEIKSKLGDRFCRDCGYCLPCSQGIDIPKINFIKVYYDQFPFSKFKDAGRSEAVKKVDDCIGYGECEEKSPYSLNIIEMTRENRDFYLDKTRAR
ncbi:MAG: 4Fe-4S dicluster domain-containing protein [Actinomycetota bacterium]